MRRDNITADDVSRRMAKQFTDEHKSSLADYKLINDEKQLLIPQVLKLHQQFLLFSKA